jgi:hypothetical protein
MAWRSHRIVANMLENTRREFGGVGWPGCGVVDIVLARGGRRQLIAKTKSGLPPGRNQLTYLSFRVLCV